MSAFLRAAACCLVFSFAGCSLSSGDDGDQASDLPLKLKIEGPAQVAPGVAASGFKARLTRGDDEAVADVMITLTPSSGTVDAPPDRPGTTGAKSDANGELAFVLHAPGDVLNASTITISGKAEADDDVAEASYAVGVTPDIFQFTEPANGTVATVGAASAVPLKFQWTHAAIGDAPAEGVSGKLTLSAGTTAFFILNDAPLPAGQSVTVQTSEDTGGFSSPVAVASNQSGAVTVTATDAAVAGRQAQLALQFVDFPATLILDADTLTVQASPSATRFSTLTATVYNQSNQVTAGAKVAFTLTPVSSSVNERVSPQVVTTGQSGTAVAKYEAGPSNGTATIKACVQDTSICDEREIKVQGASDASGSGTP